MTDFDLMKRLHAPGDAKIVLLVMDGLGGLPREVGGLTELETAKTPNLDALVARGFCGLSYPVGPGITPGSGPAHLALFGYDPVRFDIGRGVLEALGIDFAMTPRDVAARGNFCSVDASGNVTDRRAGRIPTDLCVKLCAELSAKVKVPGVELFVEPVKEHRFVLVVRGDDLQADLTETDPLVEGKPPLPIGAENTGSARAAGIMNEFVKEACAVLRDHHPANGILLRGFAKHPDLPSVRELYGLNCCAVAVYPMYRGLAKLVGMTAMKVTTGEAPADEFQVVLDNWDKFDFFFIHVKKTDSYGEDGNFDAKVGVIESVDAALPMLLAKDPDVVVVTGDHSTPATMKMHSWHGVPTLLASKWCRFDAEKTFGESACARGGWGHFKATDIIPTALAHSRRMVKYGA
jgi:2,3-bisphosphoglycerate-independent phosphoglycerate mutase